jgi:capsular polysaccharide biosynthesis protein
MRKSSQQKSGRARPRTAAAVFPGRADDPVDGQNVYTEESAIFYITAYSTVPELAVSVANAVAEAFVLEVRNVTGEDSVKILDKAETVFLSFDARSEQTKTRLTFAAGGFIAICAVIAMTELFGTKVKEVDDATLNGDIKLLGVIPNHSI